MKRFNALFFIWIFTFGISSFLSFVNFYTGNIEEFLAWMTASIFCLNTIVYHLYVTGGKDKDHR